MMIQAAEQLSFDFPGSLPVVVEASAAQVSSDAGLLPFRQLDERLGLSRQFAEALMDRRHAGLVDPTFLEMIPRTARPIRRSGRRTTWPGWCVACGKPFRECGFISAETAAKVNLALGARA